MRAIELLEKYPLTTKVIQEFYLKQLIASFDDTIPEEFKQNLIEEGITIERLAIFIDGLPRGLFDVFDENEIYIGVDHGEYNDDMNFHTNIEKHKTHHFTLTRKDGEMLGIIDAFGILEKKLTALSCDNTDS